MKYFALISTLIISGCASDLHKFKDFTNSNMIEAQKQAERDKQDSAEAIKRKNEAEAKNDAFLKLVESVCVPGKSMQEFIAAMGEPRKIEFYDSTYFFHYDRPSPMIYGFKDKKLVSWKYDEFEITNRLREIWSSSGQKKTTLCTQISDGQMICSEN